MGAESRMCRLGRWIRSIFPWPVSYTHLGLILEEVKKGIVDVDTTVVSGIDNFAPGYIDQDNEVIVGLQTDAPLKRIVNPFGGMRMAKSALEQYGYQLDPDVEKHFNLYRKTHNDGVFDLSLIHISFSAKPHEV